MRSDVFNLEEMDSRKINVSKLTHMDSIFKCILSSMNYDLEMTPRTFDVHINNVNGFEFDSSKSIKEVNGKRYEKKTFIDNERKRISIDAEGTLEYCPSNSLSVCAYCNNQGSDLFSIEDKNDFNEKYKIVLEFKNTKPYELYIIADVTKEKKDGTIDQILKVIITQGPTCAYINDGEKRKDKLTIDVCDENYLNVIRKYLENLDYFNKENIREGYKILFPALKQAVGKLVMVWYQVLDEYIKKTNDEKTKVEETYQARMSDILSRLNALEYYRNNIDLVNVYGTSENTLNTNGK